MDILMGLPALELGNSMRRPVPASTFVNRARGSTRTCAVMLGRGRQRTGPRTARRLFLAAPAEAAVTKVQDPGAENARPPRSRTVGRQDGPCPSTVVPSVLLAGGGAEVSDALVQTLTGAARNPLEVLPHASEIWMCG